MSNPITSRMKTGIIGELLVQTRLLQFDVQAASPLVDSGNDLVALRGKKCQTVQVKTQRKTSQSIRVSAKDMRREFDILALVRLVGENRNVYLDECKVYLIPKRPGPARGITYAWRKLEELEVGISELRVKELFGA